MTREQRAWIDDLIDWLDNNADGADDAGALAHNCTNWHPALVAMRDGQRAREEAAVRWALQYSIDHTAFNPDLAVAEWCKTGGAK